MSESVAIGITSFERHDCLERLLCSINRNRPIIVADNSRTAPDVSAHKNVQLVKLPFDAGLSACRNAIIKAARTPFVLICEDDFIFTPKTRVDWLSRTMRQLRPHGVNVVAGAIRNGEKAGAWLHGMERSDDGKQLILTDGPTGWIDAFPTADLTTNFFLIRRATALAHPWPEELIQGEHLAWFWSGKQNGALKIVYNYTVEIEHKHERNPFYDAHRDRLKDFRSQWLRANGFEGIQHRKAK